MAVTQLDQRPFHPPRYVDGNSPAGPARARARGYRWIDLDAHITRDGRWANNHWGIPAKDGYVYTRASIRRGVSKKKLGQPVKRHLRDTDWDVVETYRTKDGHRIPGMRAQLIRCAAAGVGAEVEPKGVPTVADFRKLARFAEEAYGLDWRDYLIVKRLTTLRGWRRCLKNAKAAGHRTAALRRRPRFLSAKYVDHYRP